MGLLQPRHARGKPPGKVITFRKNGILSIPKALINPMANVKYGGLGKENGIEGGYYILLASIYEDGMLKVSVQSERYLLYLGSRVYDTPFDVNEATSYNATVSGSHDRQIIEIGDVL